MVGIIDTTEYLDDDAFANDEVGQFMNDIFVNSTLANLPSYDAGVALEFATGAWSARGVYMSTKSDEDRSYHYLGGQLGYTLQSDLGESNYRIYGFTTNDEFSSADGKGDDESLSGFGVSFDQELGEVVGAFARAGVPDDDAAVDHQRFGSLGLQFSGELWGRTNDQAGIGVAYLGGANDSGLDDTTALELYVKFQLTRLSDLTLDLQYAEDAKETEQDTEAMIAGARFNAYF